MKQCNIEASKHAKGQVWEARQDLYMQQLISSDVDRMHGVCTYVRVCVCGVHSMSVITWYEPVTSNNVIRSRWQVAGGSVGAVARWRQFLARENKNEQALPELSSDLFTFTRTSEKKSWAMGLNQKE